MQQQARDATSQVKDTLTQRVGGLVEVPALLREFGVDPGAILGRVRLAADALDHIDNRIPFERADGLRALRVAGRAALGTGPLRCPWRADAALAYRRRGVAVHGGVPVSQ